MSTMWMIVADETEARFYALTKSGAPTLVEVLAHPEARKPSRDAGTHVPGSARSDFGSRPYSLAQGSSPADLERDRFAARVAERLDHEVATSKRHEIALVMGPQLLGLVRGHLGEQAKKIIVASVARTRIDAAPGDVAQEVRGLTARPIA